MHCLAAAVRRAPMPRNSMGPIPEANVKLTQMPHYNRQKSMPRQCQYMEFMAKVTQVDVRITHLHICNMRFGPHYARESRCLRHLAVPLISCSTECLYYYI